MKRLSALLILVSSLLNAEESTERTHIKPISDLPKIYQENAIIIDDAEALLEAMKHRDFLERQASLLPMILLPHRPNYFMPFSYTESPYDELYADVNPGLQNVEAMFQVSIKYQIYQFDDHNDYKLFIAYTNKSYWQVYNERASRPFRETNHEPELIFQMTPNWGLIDRVNIALNHQSNGQYQSFSRSWNRITTGFYHLSGDSVYGIEPWYRFKEKVSSDPDDPTDDDNPDIEKYLGYANFVWYKQHKKYSRMLKFGNNLRTKNNRGWAELEINFPLGQRLKGFIQYYEGYGHSLIEYNQYQRRLGFGIKITDYL
jgi:phospholipase A1